MSLIEIPGINNLRVFGKNRYRGGEPTPVGWVWLKEQAHVDRVIKLNDNSEGSDAPASALGMEVIYLPISPFEQLIFRPKYDDVVKAVDAIREGTFVHCKNGWDRSGLIVGCYRVWKENWAKDDAWAEMLLHGFHPELLGLTLFWEFAVH